MSLLAMAALPDSSKVYVTDWRDPGIVARIDTISETVEYDHDSGPTSSVILQSILMVQELM